MLRILILLLVLLIPSSQLYALHIYPDRHKDSSDDALVAKWNLANYNISQYNYWKGNDQRTVGIIISNLAIKYWIDQSPATFATLTDWINAALLDPDWDSRRYDILVTELLFSLSLSYDWFKTEMTPTLRANVRDFIHAWGAGVYDSSKTVDYFWAHQPFQNHNTINHVILMIAGMALLDDFTTDTTTSAMKLLNAVVNNGPFIAGETIVGSTSGATGTVMNTTKTDSGQIIYSAVSGIFVNSEVITGQTSGATSTLSSAANIRLVGDVDDWISWGKSKFDRALEYASRWTEGTNFEWHGYGDYEMTWVTRGLVALKQKYPADYGTAFDNKLWFQNSYKFEAALVVDENNQLFWDIGDSQLFKWYNPSDWLMLFYKKYGTPEFLNQARWYQDNLKTGYNNQITPVMLMQAVYTDGTEGAGVKPALRTGDYFKDVGLYSGKFVSGTDVQTSWTFISAPPGGWAQIKAFQNGELQSQEVNSGHSHPDANSIALWTDNGFIIRDTGIASGENVSIRHNTLTVNDIGQLAEPTNPLQSESNIAAVLSQTYDDTTDGLLASGVIQTNDYVLLTADAHKFYSNSLNMSKFQRSVAWIKPGVWIVYDFVNFSSGTPTTKMWWNSRFNFIQDGNMYRFGSPSKGSFQVVYPPSPTVTIAPNTFSTQFVGVVGERLGVHNTPTNGKLFYITVVDSSPTATARNVISTTNEFQMTESGHTIIMNKNTGVMTVDGVGEPEEPPPPPEADATTGMELSGVQVTGVQT